MATENFEKLELTKDIPGYKAGSRFLLKKGSHPSVWKTDENWQPTSQLGLPFDPGFFKVIHNITVETGYYARLKKDSLCHPNHLLRINTVQHIRSKNDMVNIQNLSTARMILVKYSELKEVKPYTFINSSGIISHDYIERDVNVYHLRMALGIAGTEQEMREKLLEVKNSYL